MSLYFNSDAPHWYVHLEMDVTNPQRAKEYLKEQSKIEEENGMLSFEYFADDPENPKHVLLLECFADSESQHSHIENVRLDLFADLFTNFKLEVYGNPPQIAIDRMESKGFWPPAFAGEFRHIPYWIGFKKD